MKKEIQAIRLANFRQLIKEAGNISKLAHLCGYKKPVYFYQINAKKVKPNGQTMGIGNAMARKLEAGMNKPEGWLSQEHRSTPKTNLVSASNEKSSLHICGAGCFCA